MSALTYRINTYVALTIVTSLGVLAAVTIMHVTENTYNPIIAGDPTSLITHSYNASTR